MNISSPFLKIRDLGVIVNPAAGAGGVFAEEVARRALIMFEDSRAIRPHLREGREATIRAAGEMASTVDAVLAVGGDGTMSDVAYGIYAESEATPILGIGAGSTNAGPLITVKAEEIDRMDPGALTVQEVGGILALHNGAQAGLGFNDVVLGDTVLTTLQGRVVQISAVEFMKGNKVPTAPLRVGTPDSYVSIERSGKIVPIHTGAFGQLFAAPLEERYLGKGLAGGTSLAAALGFPAGIAVSSEPLVNFSIGPDEFLTLEPIITRTASFREGDEVVVTGVREGTCLNVDGNPVVLLGPDDEARMRYIPSAARAVKTG